MRRCSFVGCVVASACISVLLSSLIISACWGCGSDWGDSLALNRPGCLLIGGARFVAVLFIKSVLGQYEEG